MAVDPQSGPQSGSGPRGGDDVGGAVITTSEHACFGGVQGFYVHRSRECAADMAFSVYTPPLPAGVRAPVLYYLAGLTCTHETFMIKAGAQRLAAELGLVLVAPDTSPRVRLPGDDAAWDFGIGAGFYVDALRPPWSAHYRMYTYVTRELPAIIAARFPVDPDRQGVFGHSMGGHGALICALREPGRYRSVSAFAPVAAPSRSPWGEKAFAGYLGEDRAAWSDWDATELVRAGAAHPDTILIDQGTADKFLAPQLRIDHFADACRAADQPLLVRMHDGYDHSYWFVSTFVADHLRHHAARLRAA